MAWESTMTKMGLSMMESGMKIKNVEGVRCFSLMALTMMASGKEIKCMVLESSSLVQGTDMKAISVTD